MLKKRELFVYVFLLHFAALMVVFMGGGGLQVILGPLLAEQLENPVLAAIISLMQVGTNYPMEKLLIGLVSAVFFIPLDISILYHCTREVFEKGDIYKGIETGVYSYPLFFVFVSDAYFLSFTYPWAAPAAIFAMLQWLEPKTPLRVHALSTILLAVWFIPIALVGRIEEPVTRNVVSLALYLLLAFPFFAHAWMRHEEMKKLKASS